LLTDTDGGLSGRYGQEVLIALSAAFRVQPPLESLLSGIVEQ
jgi:hypothetical protein